MRDRDREALARACDDATLEPMRTAFRMRRDDHLVGAEGPEGVLDRLQRIAVADLAARVDPRPAERLEARLEPLLRLGAGPVLGGGPVADRAVQLRRPAQLPGGRPLAA